MTKFLKGEEIRTIKEMMSMTLMGQLLMEDGIERGRVQGIEQGEYKILRELVADGILTAAQATARKNITETEFTEKLKELRL